MEMLNKLPKLEKREWIIIGAAAVLAVYGLFVLLTPKSKTTSAANYKVDTRELKIFVETVSKGAGTGQTGTFERHAAFKAESDWGRDPFSGSFRNLSTVRDMDIKGENRSSLVYTGFMKSSNKAIAVINGIEYESGDLLESGAYVLKRVYPTKAIIENKLDGALFEIYLQE